MSFKDAANPAFFHKDEKKFWYFYGHRYLTYKDTIPNQGFHIMNEWAEKHFKGNYFIFTSNVDRQFTKAGYDEANIYEIHGQIFRF